MSADNASPAPDEGAAVEGLARVIWIDGDSVWLEAETASACGGCSGKKGCGLSALTAAPGKGALRFRVANDFDARRGERVVVAIPAASLLKASVALYLVPTLGVIAGALAGAALSLGEAMVVVAAGTGGGLGFLAARTLGREAAGADAFRPVVRRRAPESCPDDGPSPV